jgi:hypothetical protein
MITSGDFDHFLQKGYIEHLSPGTSMTVLLTKFGDDNWITKETEMNGLIYGIIKIGFIEFHIYDEKMNGISYRPDLLFPKEDFRGVATPWIYKNREIAKVEENLINKKIGYRKYMVQGPLKTFETAGAEFFGLEDCEHTFIDTEGGVTFLFETNEKTNRNEAYQICKYYGIHKQKLTTA